MGTGFSFEIVDARDYDELRPGYAREALAWILERGEVPPASPVVDLAAGQAWRDRLAEAELGGDPWAVGRPRYFELDYAKSRLPGE